MKYSRSIISLALVFVVLMSTGFLCGSDRKKQTAQTSGVVTETGYETKRVRKSGNRNRKIKTKRTFEIVYRYTVNGVEYEEDSDRDESGAENRYRAGTQGTVCYDPNDPENSEFHLSNYTCGQ
jgi:hypothetical protein